MADLGNIDFKSIMFVYSLSEGTNLDIIDVTIPDVFVDKKVNEIENIKIGKGDMTILKNATAPAFSKYYTSKNFITLPVIKPFGGVSNVVGAAIYAVGSELNIESTQATNYPIEVGIGTVHKGDRLLAAFVDTDPTKGIILARC